MRVALGRLQLAADRSFMEHRNPVVEAVRRNAQMEMITGVEAMKRRDYAGIPWPCGGECGVILSGGMAQRYVHLLTGGHSVGIACCLDCADVVERWLKAQGGEEPCE